MRQATLDEYDPAEELREAMRRHDWYYAMSDDHRYWMAGRQSHMRIGELLAQLSEEQAQAIWDELAPEGHTMPRRP